MAEKGFADRVHGDTEVLANLGHGKPRVVELAGFFEMRVDRSPSSRHTLAFDDVQRGGAVDAEVVGYPIDWGAGAVGREQFAYLVRV